MGIQGLDPQGALGSPGRGDAEERCGIQKIHIADRLDQVDGQNAPESWWLVSSRSESSRVAASNQEPGRHCGMCSGAIPKSVRV